MRFGIVDIVETSSKFTLLSKNPAILLVFKKVSV